MPILRDATDSRAVNAVSVHAERFFWRLLQKCCDYGRYHANPTLLTSNLFPLKREIRDTDTARWLTECERAGLVRCYVDREGRQLLQVVKWKDGKKFKRSSFDPPPAEVQTTLALDEKKPARRKELEIEVEGKVNGHAPAGRKRETWQLLKDESALTDRIKHETERTKPDPDLLTALKQQRQAVRSEMKR